MTEHTTPSPETRAADRAAVEASHTADEQATPEEEAAAERTPAPDPETAEHYEEMAERGAHQRGEGRIP
jgi:hypothetical protein